MNPLYWNHYIKREGTRSTQGAKCTMCHWQLRDNPHLWWLMRWTCCAVAPVMVSVLIWDGRIWYLLTTTTWLQKVGHEVQSLIQKLRYLCANPNYFCYPSFQQTMWSIVVVGHLYEVLVYITPEIKTWLYDTILQVCRWKGTTNCNHFCVLQLTQLGCFSKN